uniref:Probable Ufm1-specific protease 2 n=1 Tax=Anopheles triannulatus TaxID=58253 RepID=A0A2M4ALG2_9DIPT
MEILQISEIVLKRIAAIKEPTTGQLHGVSGEDGVLGTVLGFSKTEVPGGVSPGAGETLEHPNLPCRIERTGWLRIGSCDDAEAFIGGATGEKGSSVLLLLPNPGEVQSLEAFFYENGGQLRTVPYKVIPEAQLFRELFVLRLRCTVTLVCEQSEKSISENAVRLRKHFETGCVAFRVPAAPDVLLSQQRVQGVRADENVEALYGLVTAPPAERDDGFGVPGVPVKASKKAANQSTLTLTGYRVIDVVTLMRKSNHEWDMQLRREACNVTIDNRNEGQIVKIPIQLDFLTVAHGNTKLQDLHRYLAHSAVRSFELIEQALVEQLREQKRCFASKCYHFMPRELGHFVTCVYPVGDEPSESDAYLQRKRAALHKEFYLPGNRPYFRKGNGYRFQSSGILQNPHQTLAVPYPDGLTAVVDGIYTYHHYMQDSFDDKGWGCAYRSLQTLISWFNLQGYSTGPPTIPSHTDIQKCLVRVGDKQPAFVGSRQWIGSTEVSICLNEFVGVDSRIMHVSSGAELAMRGRELVHHFQIQGTPIMIGGGVLAHTILGVSLDAEEEGRTKFLILDPHYTGADELGTVLSKGWCGWKGGEFWDKTSYYNLCMPQRPAMV